MTTNVPTENSQNMMLPSEAEGFPGCTADHAAALERVARCCEGALRTLPMHKSLHPMEYALLDGSAEDVAAILDHGSACFAAMPHNENVQFFKVLNTDPLKLPFDSWLKWMRQAMELRKHDSLRLLEARYFSQQKLKSVC